VYVLGGTFGTAPPVMSEWCHTVCVCGVCCVLGEAATAAGLTGAALFLSGELQTLLPENRGSEGGEEEGATHRSVDGSRTGLGVALSEAEEVCHTHYVTGTGTHLPSL
jgi:hypothetical protein